MPLIDRTFSDIITFTRASAATMFDSAGTLVYAPMNAIRNNTMQGAVAGVIGSGGAAPTNWSYGSSASGLTREVVGTGTENGVTYIDLKVSGTSTSSGTVQISPEAATGVAALTGQTWTGAWYVKLVSGSFPGAINWVWLERDSGGSAVVTAPAIPFGPPDGSDLNTQRYTNTRTLSGGASVAYITLRVDITVPNSTAINFTVRIGLPQLELGSVARTAIATSGTAYQGPRFDYDPVTLAARGMLIEEQRTNLLTYSSDLTQAAWGKALGTATVTVTGDATTSPDGTVNADKVITANATGDHLIAQVTSVTSGLVYTQTWFLKAAELNWVQVTESTGFGSTDFQNIDLSNGTVGNGNYGSAVTVTSVGNGWYRVTVTDTATATSASGRFLLALLTSNVAARLTDITGDGTSGVYIWGAQLEAGAFPTSYIPTTTAAATRAADVASVNTLSPWFNAAEGTILVEASPQASNVVTFNLVDFNNTTTSNRIALSKAITSGNASLFVNDAASPQCNISSATWTATGKLAAAYKVDDFATSYNGATPATDTTGTVPSVTRMQIGVRADGANQLTGHIRRIGYYKRRLSNAQLQAITQ